MRRWKRISVTLDPDTDALVRRVMSEKGVTFTRALNDAIRAGAPEQVQAERRTLRTRDMGVPVISLAKATQLDAALEDAEVLRKLAAGQGYS